MRVIELLKAWRDSWSPITCTVVGVVIFPIIPALMMITGGIIGDKLDKLKEEKDGERIQVPTDTEISDQEERS